METLKLNEISLQEYRIFNYFRYLINDYSYSLRCASLGFDEKILIYYNSNLDIEIQIEYDVNYFTINLTKNRSGYLNIKSIDGKSILQNRGKRQIVEELEKNLENGEIEKNLKFFSNYFYIECKDQLLGKSWF